MFLLAELAMYLQRFLFLSLLFHLHRSYLDICNGFHYPVPSFRSNSKTLKSKRLPRYLRPVHPPNRIETKTEKTERIMEYEASVSPLKYQNSQKLELTTLICVRLVQYTYGRASRFFLSNFTDIWLPPMRNNRVAIARAPNEKNRL